MYGWLSDLLGGCLTRWLAAWLTVWLGEPLAGYLTHLLYT